MGRPRIKVMDDSVKENQEERIKNKAKKTSKQSKTAKSEVDKASGKVERTTEVNESSQEQGAKQTPSERIGDASDALQPDELSEKKQVTGIADQNKKPSEPSQKKQKPGKAKPRSKKYQQIVKDLDRTKTYSLPEAVDMVKKLSYAKFNATLEVHINTAQTGIRGLVSLPYAKGRQLRILCFGPSTTSQLEGVVFGTDSTIEEINKGKVDFDLIITTPDWMPRLAKVARILGPRGLMPNPKNNTIVSNEAELKKCVESFQAGKTEYKTEPKAPVIHVALGKLNQPNEELVANIKTLLATIGKSRIKRVSLSPTMGPGVKLDLSSI